MNDFSQVSPSSFTALTIIGYREEIMFNAYGFKGHETIFTMYEE